MNFNTSYVVVQQIVSRNVPRTLIHFNTSYVVVQLFYFECHFFSFCISIHLMLWFNHCWYVIAIFYYTEVLLKWQHLLCFFPMKRDFLLVRKNSPTIVGISTFIWILNNFTVGNINLSCLRVRFTHFQRIFLKFLLH